jgi:hypothetical protein
VRAIVVAFLMRAVFIADEVDHLDHQWHRRGRHGADGADEDEGVDTGGTKQTERTQTWITRKPELNRLESAATKAGLSGCLFKLLSLLWISFRKIKKLDGQKNEKLRSSWKVASSFSLLDPSNFWISQKLIKNDEKLETNTPPKFRTWIDFNRHICLDSSPKAGRESHWIVFDRERWGGNRNWVVFKKPRKPLGFHENNHDFLFLFMIFIIFWTSTNFVGRILSNFLILFWSKILKWTIVFLEFLFQNFKKSKN